MYNTSKFTTILTMIVSCILCSCSNTVATERITRITFYSSSDQVKLSLDSKQPVRYIKSSLKPKSLLKNVQTTPPTNLIPVLKPGVVSGMVIIGIMILPVVVIGAITIIGIILAVISISNINKDKTGPEAKTQSLFQGTKTRVLGHVTDFWEKWMGKLKDKADRVIPTTVPSGTDSKKNTTPA